MNTKLMQITLLTLLAGSFLNDVNAYTETNYIPDYQNMTGNVDNASQENINKMRTFLINTGRTNELDSLNKAVRNYYIKKTAKWGFGIATVCGLGYLGYQAYNNQDAIKDEYNNFTDYVSENGLFNVITTFAGNQYNNALNSASKATTKVASYFGGIFGNWFGSKPVVNQETVNNDIESHDNEQSYPRGYDPESHDYDANS